jgi:hypothetical protein
MYFIHCKNLCKYSNVCSPSTTIKKLNFFIKKKRIGKTLEHINITIIFLNRTPISQQLGERIEQWDYIETKKLLHSKGNSHQT